MWPQQKIHSHHNLSRVHTLSMNYHWWSKPQSLGWGTALYWNFLFYFFLSCCSPWREVIVCSRSLGVGGLLHLSKEEYLHEVFGIIFIRYLPLLPQLFIYCHIFVCVCIPGYFNYGLGNNALLFYLFLKWLYIWPLKLFHLANVSFWHTSLSAAFVCLFYI